MKTKTLEDTLRELQSQKMDSMEENKGLKEKNEDLQDLEFQYEELKLKYEEQEERTEKFSVMAREKLKPFKMIKMIWMKPKPNLKLKSIRLWQREMNVFRNFLIE